MSPPQADPVLSVEGLGRRFGRKIVFSGLSFTLGPGERVGLHGPNGSGKTTILRCVAGTLMPSAGLIVVAGHPAGSFAARGRVGVSLSQERSFYLRLSARANLQFFARLRYPTRAGAAEAVTRVEQELELHSFLDERVDRCSTGMIQQLAVARALLGEPSLVLLDEPTRSLDDAAVERLWEAVERRGVALLIATHHTDDLDRCHRTIELRP